MLDLLGEELTTVPVSLERLDVYTCFLVPAHCRPRRHRRAETTDLMLQLAAAGRGVTVLPDWLVQEEGSDLPVRAVRLGPDGIGKIKPIFGSRLLHGGKRPKPIGLTKDGTSDVQASQDHSDSPILCREWLDLEGSVIRKIYPLYLSNA